MREANINSKYVLLPLLLVVFLDVISFGIVIPILAPLLLENTQILSPDITYGQRTFILGLLTSIFAIAQFFGSPILGALSDRLGRKKVLTIALLGRTFGHLVFAYGVMTNNIWLLFASRAFSGFSAGDMAVAFSAVADLSKREDKAKNFGYMSMVFGLGFIVGPFFGGKLADPTIVSWFNNSTPFYFAALVTFINVIVLKLFFKETLNTSISSKISLLTGIQNLQKAWKLQNLRTIFIVIFFLMFGFSLFMQFFQVFLYEKFHFNPSQIGDMFAYMGICNALAQGVVVQPMSRRFSSETILSFSELGFAAILLIMLIPKEAFYLYLTIPILAIFQGLTQPNARAIVSNLAPPEAQGEILGVNQSVMSASMAIPPILAGTIIAININLPIIVAAATIFLSWVTFVFFFKKKAY